MSSILPGMRWAIAVLAGASFAACTDVATVDSGETPSDGGSLSAIDASSADATNAQVLDAGADTGNELITILDTAVVSHIVEPEGSGIDDAGNTYTDKNYWNFCAPGAATAALYYFFPSNVTAWPAGSFKEPKNAPATIPSAGTYWRSSSGAGAGALYGRAYMMYLAMQSTPPSFSSAGMLPYDTYPTIGAYLEQIRDVLNWEASAHSGGWSNFFYTIVASTGLTTKQLHDDVKKDIRGGHAIVAAVDTAHLPNWSRSLGHAITVIGYDDVAGTYQYVDTCGIHCNGSPNAKDGGVWTIEQVALFDAIATDGSGYLR